MKKGSVYPLPAQQEPVSVQSTIGALYGVIDLPQGEQQCPAVLVIAGSGPTDRDGNSAAMKKHNDSLKMLAGQLVSWGIAALRYDKRGVGESKSAAGVKEETRFEDMIADASLWLESLKANARFSTLGIVGHSQGSLVGMCPLARGLWRSFADFWQNGTLSERTGYKASFFAHSAARSNSPSFIGPSESTTIKPSGSAITFPPFFANPSEIGFAA